jgi:hypothetical protein
VVSRWVDRLLLHQQRRFTYDQIFIINTEVRKTSGWWRRYQARWSFREEESHYRTTWKLLEMRHSFAPGQASVMLDSSRPTSAWHLLPYHSVEHKLLGFLYRKLWVSESFVVDITDYFRSGTLLFFPSQKNQHRSTFWTMFPGGVMVIPIPQAPLSCNLLCRCHMVSTHHPIPTSPTNFFHNQIQLRLSRNQI